MRHLIQKLLPALVLIAATSGAAPADDTRPAIVEKPGAFQELTSPNCVRAKEESTLPVDDVILGVVRGDEQCAYPLRVMGEHRIINDSLGGPFVITWDADSSSARAFVPVIDGKRLFFKFHGWHKGVMLMRDNETGSLWSHMTGEAIDGPSKGKTLDPIPARAATWKSWKDTYRDSWVLGFDYEQTYDTKYPALTPTIGDEARKSLAKIDDRRKPEVRVLGVKIGDEYKAYEPGKWTGIRSERRGDTTVLIIRSAAGETAALKAPADLVVRMVNDNGVTLVADEATGQMYDLSGQPVGPRKVERGPLVPVPVVETKWYAWAAFHPETTIETLK